MEKAFDVLRAKMAARNLTYADLGKAVGLAPVFVAAVMHGRQRLNPPEAEKLAAALGAPEAVAAVSGYPVRTDFPITTDPFKYRLLEIVGVYGDPLRALANEMFGDGIMSAIDFTMDVEKVVGPEGETRMRITMCGKWLPYKQF